MQLRIGTWGQTGAKRIAYFREDRAVNPSTHAVNAGEFGVWQAQELAHPAAATVGCDDAAAVEGLVGEE